MATLCGCAYVGAAPAIADLFLFLGRDGRARDSGAYKQSCKGAFSPSLAVVTIAVPRRIRRPCNELRLTGRGLPFDGTCGRADQHNFCAEILSGVLLTTLGHSQHERVASSIISQLIRQYFQFESIS